MADSAIPIARPDIGEAEFQAVAGVLASGNLAQGEEVELFEAEFSEQVVGGLSCIAVNSGTSALHLIMLAIGLGPGDEVIVPSFTFAATANVVAITGAKPVFVDIEPKTYCIDPDAVEAALSKKTKAVMPVHLYGHPARMDALQSICRQRDLVLIEDAAQAHMSVYQGQPIGTWGDAAAFSFYPTKNMTSGEGGMVVTNNDCIAERVRLLRNQGQLRRYENQIVGLNNRMTDIHAAIGRVQLRSLPERTAKRVSHARWLMERLEGVETPHVAPEIQHVFHQFTVRVPAEIRTSFVADLAEQGISTGIYYPTPVHRLAAFALELDLPETDLAAREVVSLPVIPSLSEPDLERIVEAVNNSARRLQS